MLRIYYGELSAVPDQPDGLPLSAYRLRQLSSCRSDLRRRQGIGAELLLIRALKTLDLDLCLPLVLTSDQSGKPFLSGCDLYFSLSHSGLYAACAVCDRAVGLDLECRRPLRQAVLRRCFSLAEQNYVKSSPDPDAAFTELWTRKESYGKATGEGLSSLRAELDLLHPSPVLGIWSRDLGAFHLSVCVPGSEAVPDVFERLDLP